jgi:hypothetical protein
MNHFYIAEPSAEKGFIELTETEWLSLFGTDDMRPYAKQVYQDTLSINEVPEELREQVQTIVNNKIARWGLYKNRNIPDSEETEISTDEEADGEATKQDLYNALAELGVTEDEEG